MIGDRSVRPRKARSRRAFKVGFVAIATLIVAACGPMGPLRVGTIQLGRSLNADKSVAASATTFKPYETVYVSLLTEGAGKGTVAVSWRYAGQVIAQSERSVAYTQNAASEFHLQNAAGFPVGEYTVEIMLDGQTVATRNFRVVI
jgi:hypothetical protein